MTIQSKKKTPVVMILLLFALISQENGKSLTYSVKKANV